MTVKEDFYLPAGGNTLRPNDDDSMGAGDVIKVAKGDKIHYAVGKYYIGNTTDDADQDYMAGDGGIVLKPTKNDDNEITWEDENNTIATLKFYSDDDAAKFFPKLTLSLIHIFSPSPGRTTANSTGLRLSRRVATFVSY